MFVYLHTSIPSLNETLTEVSRGRSKYEVSVKWLSTSISFAMMVLHIYRHRLHTTGCAGGTMEYSLIMQYITNLPSYYNYYLSPCAPRATQPAFWSGSIVTQHCSRRPICHASWTQLYWTVDGVARSCFSRLLNQHLHGTKPHRYCLICYVTVQQ